MDGLNLVLTGVLKIKKNSLSQRKLYQKLSLIVSTTAVLYVICCFYCTAQFKLDRICIQQGHYTTCFSFHTLASLHVHAKLMKSNLPCKALVYTLDVCAMHACLSGMHMPNLDYMCMQIVSQARTAE